MNNQIIHSGKSVILKSKLCQIVNKQIEVVNETGKPLIFDQDEIPDGLHPKITLIFKKKT